MILDNKTVDRSIGNQCFETLLKQGLLMYDYFILTSTKRPIQCYAKVLPTNDEHRENLSYKLQPYNIQLSDYMDLSQSIAIQTPSKLSDIGEQLFSRSPYSSIFDINTERCLRANFY